MRRELFVPRRHAGHDHGTGDGYGVRVPPKGAWPESLGRVSSASTPLELELPTEPERVVDPVTLTPLSPGSSEGALVYFDAPSGAGGDMLVASLVDLGVPWSVVTQATDCLDLSGVRLELRRGNSGSLSGLRFVVNIEAEAGRGERSYAQIRDTIAASRLAPGVIERSLRVFERLARAESRAHHVPMEAVHFHEVGALDSIVDIVGACAALDYLGAAVWCSPMPLGRGFVTCRHGVIPLPAPATVECLLGLQTYDSGIDKELVTPTAAAVFGALSAGCSGWPSGLLVAVGWGRGSMTLPDRPNLLRAVLVRPTPDDEQSRAPRE